MISSAFAQASVDSVQSNLMSFAPLVLMFIALYFIMIRPQMKRQKEHRSMLSALVKGDEVVTGSGIMGRITKINDSYVSIEIAENVEIKMQKNAVVMLLPKGTMKSI